MSAISMEVWSADRSILHVDGDAFFASCEVARNPALYGKPVVTGQERGIVSAATYEAKALGISRATPLHEVRKRFPEVVIVRSDYKYYKQVSLRMYAIVRRHASNVEEYGVDECFADLSDLAEPARVARRIKEELQRELNMTFSLGVGATKVLAKLGSKHQKPDGFTIVSEMNRLDLLRKTEAKNVWGIGYRTTKALLGLGISTAYEFADQDEAWVALRFPKPLIELWHELNGRSVMPVANRTEDQQQSIQRTRTFTPPSTDPARIFSELSKNVELACQGARAIGLSARHASFFLKTQAFRYHGGEITLPMSSHAPQDFIRELRAAFLKAYRKNTLYRATGITLFGLRPEDAVQLDLFEGGKHRADMERLFKEADKLDRKYGKHLMYLGTSAKARDLDRRLDANTEHKKGALLESAYGMRRLPLPFMGEVS